MGNAAAGRLGKVMLGNAVEERRRRLTVDTDHEVLASKA